MKILIVGSGAREHAIGLKIMESNDESVLYFLPGNGGTQAIGKNVNSFVVDDFESVLTFIKNEGISFVIIGPEKPLVLGIVDFLGMHGIPVFGPSMKAAQLEADKSFAKKLMVRAGVPTAAFQEFNRDELALALEYIKSHPLPVVIKASGLAAGKGVIIAETHKQAEAAINSMLVNNLFGNAGDIIVIEEFMQGEEVSLFAVTDGTNFVLLPPAQDYKRIGDNDTGKNTGGMGAFAPAKVLNEKMIQSISDRIIKPILSTMQAEGYPFRGCLYAGLMLSADGARVVEFNCRFGDPETQSILNTFTGDFLGLLLDASNGLLQQGYIYLNGAASVTVVAASKGYPDTFETGYEIKGLNELPSDIKVYHAGTAFSDGKVFTTGGRVLSVTSVVEDGSLKDAINLVYEAVVKISYDNMIYRTDIAQKGLKYTEQ